MSIIGKVRSTKHNDAQKAIVIEETMAGHFVIFLTILIGTGPPPRACRVMYMLGYFPRICDHMSVHVRRKPEKYRRYQKGTCNNNINNNI